MLCGHLKRRLPEEKSTPKTLLWVTFSQAAEMCVYRRSGAAPGSFAEAALRPFFFRSSTINQHHFEAGH
jgi:hypothetical protein